MARWGTVTVLIVLAVLYETSLVKAQQKPADNYICPREGTWTFVEDFGELRNVYCFSVNVARGFAEAQAYCHFYQAELFSTGVGLDLSLPSGSPLTELMKKNDVNSSWYGFHAVDDRLRYDQYPLPPTQDDTAYSEAVKFQILWDRSEPRGTSECFKASSHCESDFGDGIDEFPGFDPSGDGGFTPSESSAPSPSEPAAPTGGLAKRSVETTIRKMLGLGSSAEKERVKRTVNGEFPCSWTVSSHPCNDPLPFVCVKPALERSAQRLERVEPICEADEFGNYQLRRCISYGVETVNLTTAQSRCQAMGADSNRPRTLYRPQSIHSARFLNQLVVDAISLDQRRNFETEIPPGSMAWVEGAKDVEGCVALIMDPDGNSQTVSWDCAAQLPFYVCQHAANRKESSEPVLTYRTSQRDFSPDGEITSEMIPSTTDTQVSLPYEIAASESNEIFSMTCAYQGGLVPEIQNMTIVKGGFIVAGYPSFDRFEPNRQKRQAILPEAPEKRVDTVQMTVPDYGNFFIWGKDPLSRIADYYWCEVNDLKSGKIRRSDRIFLRVRGMQLYAASIVLDTTEDQQRELILYSMTGHDRIQEFGSFKELVANATLYSYRWLRFRPDLSRPNSNATIVDFYVFKREVSLQEEFKPTNWTIANTATILRDNFFRTLDTNFFLVRTLSLRSIDICPYQEVYDPVSNRTYEVPDTPIGEFYRSSLTCLSNGLPYVTLKCDGDKLYGAKWSKFEPNNGCNFTTADTSPVTTTLKGISQSDINNASVAVDVNKTVMTIEDIKTLQPVDVVYIADILQKATDVVEISPETGKQILQIVDTVNQLDDEALEGAQDLGNATNRIIKSVDRLGDKLSLDGDPNRRLVTDSAALEVWDVSRVTGNIIIGLELRLDGAEPVSVLETDDLISLFESGRLTYKATDAAIVLPGPFVRKVKDENPDKDVKLSMNVYASTGLFRNGRLYNGSEEASGNSTLNSKVISAKITVNGAPVSDLESYAVTTVYLPFVETPEETRPQNTTCVFWDLEGAGGRGTWSSEGCRYQQTLEGRDVCVCDHLTNFAVLVDLYGQSALPQEHQFALTVITIIGLCLSIAGLSITIISFILIPKLRQGRPQQTLFNMALAMLVSWVIFLAGFTRVESHEGCIAVAALLHYFILASFMWMLMEGILQYLLFVKVFGTDFDNYMLKTGIPAWGIPLLPVIVVLAIDVDMYRGGDQYCWMSLTPFYYAFLLPVGLIMLANIIIYIMVVVAICRRRDMASHANRSGASQKVIGIRASVACFVVLGLSWVFAFFAVEDARVVFQYLFTITSSIQGFLIFIIFTARDPQVRAFWRAKCCGKKSTQKKFDKSHVQGQRSHTGSDEYPLNRSNQSSSTDDPRHYHSRRTSPSTLPPPSGAHTRAGYGNGYGNEHGNEVDGHRNLGYHVYTGE